MAPAHTSLQRALFQEKRHLIEHALFGVDLNPNSVRICRLRLWIELLKHAYYRPETGFEQLETLPNLELNIKVWQLAALPLLRLMPTCPTCSARASLRLATYRDVVHAYFNSRDRAAKQELQQFLGDIKEQFTATIYRGDPLRREVSTLKTDLLRVDMDARPDMFGKARLTEEEAWEKTTVLRMRLKKAEDKLAQREKGILYRDAFEWRFEFPEVLDEKGRFRGFDVVIGNPPYIRADEQSLAQRRTILASNRFQTLSEKWDLYVAFMELGCILLKDGGFMSMIVSDAYCHAKYAISSQEWFLKNTVIARLDFFKDFMVFGEANVGSIIPFIEKRIATDVDIYSSRSGVRIENMKVEG